MIELLPDDEFVRVIDAADYFDVSVDFLLCWAKGRYAVCFFAKDCFSAVLDFSGNDIDRTTEFSYLGDIYLELTEEQIDRLRGCGEVKLTTSVFPATPKKEPVFSYRHFCQDINDLSTEYRFSSSDGLKLVEQITPIHVKVSISITKESIFFSVLDLKIFKKKLFETTSNCEIQDNQASSNKETRKQLFHGEPDEAPCTSQKEMAACLGVTTRTIREYKEKYFNFPWFIGKEKTVYAYPSQLKKWHKEHKVKKNR